MALRRLTSWHRSRSASVDGIRYGVTSRTSSEAPISTTHTTQMSTSVRRLLNVFSSNRYRYRLPVVSSRTIRSATP